MMNQMNPNSFISFEGEWSREGTKVTAEVVETVALKDIVGMEEFRNANKELTHYWVKIKILTRDNNYSLVKFKVNQDEYLRIRTVLNDIDFNIPITEVAEQVAGMVKKEVRNAISSISTLQLQE